MPIRFRCPHCQKMLGVKDHLAGKKAKCVQCSKIVLIPKAQGPAELIAQPAPARIEPTIERPPEELDSLAAAAFSDPPAEAPPEDDEQIKFTCDFCEHEITVPRAEAGKRIQCPSEDCRQLVRVPVPEQKKKDWRDVKVGKTIEQMRGPEKIDEAAWGTHTDKVKVSRGALDEAEALPPPKKEPVGVRGWVRRGMWTVGVLGAAALVVLFVRNVGTGAKVKETTTDLEDLAKSIPTDRPEKALLRAAVHRTIGEYHLRRTKPFNAVRPFQSARAEAKQAGAARVDSDLFLLELAVLQVDLGGTDFDAVAKERLEWRFEALKELTQTLEAIQAAEVKAMALREVGTRLLEKKQAPIAASLAGALANRAMGNPLVGAQQQVFTLTAGQKAAVEEPDPAKGVANMVARIAYAENHARDQKPDAALALVQAPGPAIHRLEAALGVAGVILSAGKNPKDAKPFLDEAVKAAGELKMKSLPWEHLQLVRVAARVDGKDAAKDLIKDLSPPFRPRAFLEILRAECDEAPAPLGVDRLADLEAAGKDPPTLDLGWEALARQNARVGSAADLKARARDVDGGRFTPMVIVGGLRGTLDRGGPANP
jgi:hypothetical protein